MAGTCGEGPGPSASVVVDDPKCRLATLLASAAKRTRVHPISCYCAVFIHHIIGNLQVWYRRCGIALHLARKSGSRRRRLSQGPRYQHPPAISRTILNAERAGLCFQFYHRSDLSILKPSRSRLRFLLGVYCCCVSSPGQEVGVHTDPISFPPLATIFASPFHQLWTTR